MASLHLGFPFSEREILFKISFTYYSPIADLVVPELAIVIRRSTLERQTPRIVPTLSMENFASVAFDMAWILFASQVSSGQSRPPASGIIDDYLIDDVLAFPGSRRTLILLQE